MGADQSAPQDTVTHNGVRANQPPTSSESISNTMASFFQGANFKIPESSAQKGRSVNGGVRGAQPAFPQNSMMSSSSITSGTMTFTDLIQESEHPSEKKPKIVAAPTKTLTKKNYSTTTEVRESVCHAYTQCNEPISNGCANLAANKMTSELRKTCSIGTQSSQAIDVDEGYNFVVLHKPAMHKCSTRNQPLACDCKDHDKSEASHRSNSMSLSNTGSQSSGRLNKAKREVRKLPSSAKSEENLRQYEQTNSDIE